MTDNNTPWRYIGDSWYQRDVPGFTLYAGPVAWWAYLGDDDCVDGKAGLDGPDEAREAADRWAADRFGLPTRETGE